MSRPVILIAGDDADESLQEVLAQWWGEAMQVVARGQVPVREPGTKEDVIVSQQVQVDRETEVSERFDDRFPVLARQWVNHLTEGVPFDSAVDLQRFVVT